MKIGGRDPSISVRRRGIPDPLGEVFYVKKVVIALHVFVWRLIVGIALLENHLSFNLLICREAYQIDLN